MNLRTAVFAMLYLSASTCLTGCGGMLARAVSTETASYQEVAMKAGELEPDESRIWIYAVGGDPDVWNTTGRQEGITFNRTAYFCLGETFFHLDMPAGEYVDSMNNVMGGFGAPRMGKVQKSYRFESGGEYFLRVQMEKTSAVGTDVAFDLVDKHQALPEMEPLKRFTDQYDFKVRGE